MPALHGLTGMNSTSKVGTKAAAVNMSAAEEYRLEFGIGSSNDIDFTTIEEFLVRLFRKAFKMMEN